MQDVTFWEFMFGTLLGDGCIAKLNKGAKTHRWSCGHSENQLDYLRWKVNYLSFWDLHTGNITKHVSNSKRYKNPCVSYYTKSRSDEIFSEYRELFYPKDKRLIPRIDLTPNILSILYMDDGHLLKRPGRTDKAVYNLHSFTNEDREWICFQFSRFNIKATCRHKNGEVAISAYSMDNFRKIIEVLPMFQYKMGPV